MTTDQTVLLGTTGVLAVLLAGAAIILWSRSEFIFAGLSFAGCF